VPAAFEEPAAFAVLAVPEAFAVPELPAFESDAAALLELVESQTEKVCFLCGLPDQEVCCWLELPARLELHWHQVRQTFRTRYRSVLFLRLCRNVGKLSVL
jgi:hypothetical protein